jgi:hypothetical protein
MQEITLLVALVSGFVVMCVSPLYGLIVYLAMLGWYPSYLTIDVGGVNFTVSRIVILLVLLNAALRSTERFKLIWLDKMVVIYFVFQLAAGVTTTEMFELFQNRAGEAFDAMLPYFAIRLIVRQEQEYATLLKALIAIAVPLAIIGFYQCLTGRNPFGHLKLYYAWRQSQGYVPIPRHGFFRADVTFPMSIMFGLFFSMYGPLIAGLLAYRRRALAWVGLAIMAMGVFDSMSSGPMLGAILAAMFIFGFRFRRYWPGVVIAMIVACVVVEILSNRHFYDVLGSFTLSPGTAWYRSKLIDVAFFRGGMTGYWITGHGFADPGWSLLIDNRDHTDIVNEYLLVLSIYGLVGLVPYIIMICAAVSNLALAYRNAVLSRQQWLIWCLSASLFGTLGAMFSVSLFGQPTTVFFTILGLCGCMTGIIQRGSMSIAHIEYDRQEHQPAGRLVSNK